jgi:hypothetical protein
MSVIGKESQSATSRKAVYWKGSGEADSYLIKSLRNLGLAVEIIAEFASINEIQTTSGLEVVVLDLIGNKSDTSNKLITLFESGKKFSSCKILLVGRVPDDRLRSLSKVYSELVVLYPPITDDALEKVSWLKPVNLTNKITNSDVKDNTVSVLRIKSLYNGNNFALANSKDHFELPAITSFPKLLSVFNRIWKTNPKSALRGQRVAASAASLAKGIGLSEKKQTDLAQAAFLLHGLSGENQKEETHINYDFFLLPKSSTLASLSNVYQETSAIVASDLGLPDAARYISELSAHLNQASRNEDSPAKVSDSVGCLLIPELAERSVWQHDKWDRYALSRMMRKLLEGKFFSFSSKLVVAFGKMVAEAFGLRLLVHPESAKIYESKLPYADEIVAEAEQKATEQLNGRIVSLMPVSDLKVGMTLLAPVVTQDGVLLLRSDLILDESIISCLQNLAAIRPIQSLIAVEKINTRAQRPLENSH